MKYRRVNNIEFVEEIGSGGTATVLKGVDLNTGRLVAVKVLWTNLFRSEAMRKQFIFEANQYLYLAHPSIVRLHDFIIKDDAHYLVMEYVEGQNLEEYINKVSGPIPEERAVEYMKEILDAIGFAHSRNVYHLDIKPANLMIDQGGKIRVLDFGISKETNQLTNGKITGSPLYMSPEQTTGESVDQRSDIYSLGVTLFQMLTGTTPFKGNVSRDELFRMIRSGKMAKAKEFYPFVSDQLQSVIDRATMADRNHRFQNTEEFAYALQTAHG